MSSSSAVRVVVPPEHRWLTVLHRAMAQMGQPVRDVVLGDGRLRVAGASDATARLRVVLSPHRPDRPCYAKLGPFALSYEGARELGPDGERLLRAFAAAVRRLGAHIPPRLHGFAAIVEAERSPEETLSKVFPFVTVERSRGPNGEDSVEVLLRTTPGCNQACPFCSAPHHAQPNIDAVLACIREAADLLPSATLSITGGEPTLKKTFVEEVRAALAEERLGSVQVQTNAVSFASRLDPRELPPSPRLSFFVSLHAMDAAVYDACTSSAGQMGDALAGIDRLLAASHCVTLNTVVSSLNLGHLEELAATLPSGPPGNRAVWHLSALICPHGNSEAPRHLVRYSELIPTVRRAREIAMARGIETSSLLSSTHATVPPCVVPEARETDRRWMVPSSRRDRSAPSEPESRGGPPDHVKAEGCAACVEHDSCPGVPSAYAERFGLAELRPLPPIERRDEFG